MSSGLRVRAVSKRYGGVQVLDAVSLAAPPGEVTALIGPNGAGKSTLANVISGFVAPEQGEITLDGRSLAGAPAAARAPLGLGRTFQNLEIFTGMTVLDNVMMGAYSTGRAGLRRAVLPRRGARREDGELRAKALAMLAEFELEHAADVAVEELAFGQAKLVEMARVLVLGPSVLVLDEPAAGLPPASADALATRISGLAERGVGVLLIEHNMKLVMSISDRVIVLDQGRVLVEGAPAQVQADVRVIEAYLGPSYQRAESQQ
jgi:ABC-type branched-subunit amino acid transport system ATPase component